MRITAEDLILDGYFDTSYVEKAIENVEEYGSYIIVNKGIALGTRQSTPQHGHIAL